MMKFINRALKNRYVILISFFVAFFVITGIFTKSIVPAPETKNIWFYSGLAMLIFSILFIEPYYSSPKNVITNTLPLLLVLLSIKDDLNDKDMFFWWASLILYLLIVVLAVVAMELSSQNYSPDSFRNRVSGWIRRVVVLFGQGKVLYSIFFVYFLMSYRNIQDKYTLIMFLFWGAILAINPKKVQSKWLNEGEDNDANAIGDIFGVQSGNMFLVKLYEDKNNIKKFDVVEFVYAIDSNSKINKGLVFDKFFLDNERWAKVLKLQNIETETHGGRKKNVVYQVSKGSELSQELKVDRFVGVVAKRSEIGKIRFDYSKREGSLEEGDLIELLAFGKRVFYQVFNGITEIEELEKDNKSGYISGEAVQLGTWDEEKLSFNKFGWVPAINTPVFMADTSNIEVPQFDYPCFQLGVIPGTTLPSVLDLYDAVSHHTAFVGVTGSGKSFLTRLVIEQLLRDTKVICVDFTGEWKKVFSEKAMAYTVLNSQNMEEYLGNDCNLGLVEMPNMANTVEVIQSTERLLSSIFNYAKTSYDAGHPCRICLILEEAHTIVPESSFLGVNNWESKAVVNKMGQIALQGRKYGVGLFVIAQRTANVSKTILTQCNTIICFQAYDETSFLFLGNYIGKEMVQALPTLKQYHAIVTGKAVRSNIPMIVDLTR